MVDRVHDVVAPAHLDRLELPLVFAHILEHVRLQVPVEDEDGTSGHVLESLLEGFEDGLHGLEGRLRREDQLHVLVYQLDLLDVDPRGRVATHRAKRRHRVPVHVLQTVGVDITVAAGRKASLFSLSLLALLGGLLFLLLFQDLLDTHDIALDHLVLLLEFFQAELGLLDIDALDSELRLRLLLR